MWHLLNFVLGAIIGSFLNVVIYRLPRSHLSILKPARSICPKCGAQIAWYDNIPILSYFILRGKCRNCGSSISVRYPLVETVSALAYLANSFVPNLVVYLSLCLFASCAIVMSCIDFEFLAIPDVTLVLSWVAGFLVWWMKGFPVWNAVGAAAAMFLLWLLGIVYRGGMGEGDVVLIGAIGIGVGFIESFYVLLASSVSAIIYALVKGKGRLDPKQKIPFGTFLAPAGYAILLVNSLV
ncbi:prepilin peptidase [Thermotoga caldifontis]|uniref:prepilin peptidase n=1 Tax=Thermotoga caldifontis TaxID=1508419 RepID=UPI0005977D78|nr:A24 family peptidase [Thermotoga caldifontis]